MHTSHDSIKKYSISGATENEPMHVDTYMHIQFGQKAIILNLKNVFR